MSIGTFTLVRNESPWIAAHLLRILPFVDECVLYDGNSTDGTIEIIEAIHDNNENGHKIRLFKNKDPKNLREDYVRLFNECMRSLQTDLAWFLHPDMHCVNPDQILLIKDSPAVCLSVHMRSFGGEPGGQLFEMEGRGKEWKSIYRLRNPDLGAHYFGDYGHTKEDVYFSAITGDQHAFYDNFESYPYTIVKSGIDVLHFSDVRLYERRHSRMMTCLLNNDWPADKAKAKAATHPRVTLKDGDGYKFTPSRYPDEFLAHQAQYKHLVKELSIV